MLFADAINEVRNRINIVDIISSYVRLKRTGSNYMGCCPFHNEKTPSFSVSESKQIFKCFGCGKGGNVYTFLQEQEGMTFKEAVKFLAKKVNITIEDDYRNNDLIQKKRDELYKLYKDIANTYYMILMHSEEGRVALEYLHKRGLTNATIKKFALGYAPKSYGKVYKMMLEKGYDSKLLVDSKLFGINDKGAYDFFYNRVMFPLVDLYGNVVSFQGRILEEKGNQKYINTAETVIYKKSKHLFGINHAKNTKKDFYILCEGNMDVISINQAGYENAVASWGTAFTEEQASLIKRKVKKVYLSQDTDDAGIKSIVSASKTLQDLGIETYVIDYSPCKDADEFILKYGIEAFNNKINNPMETFMFLISILKRQYNLSNQYDYQKYIEEIVSKLTSIKNELVRDKYIKDVATMEGIEYDKLLKQVDIYLYNKTISNNSIIDNYKNKNDIKNINNDYIFDIESKLISMLYDNFGLKNKISNYLSSDELNDIDIKSLYNFYLDGKNVNEVIDEFASDDIKKDKINSILFSNNNNYENNNRELYSAITELVRKIKIYNIDKNSKNDIESILNDNALKQDVLKINII